MAEFTQQQLDSVLQRVLELPAEAREAFLDETCGQKTEMRGILERMLAAGESADSLLTPGGAMSGPLWDELIQHRVEPLESGEEVGVYRVLRTLGYGGMAVVYLAERADGQFEQQIALKVLHPSKHVEEIARRFEQERQILASLNHPNIAHLIDGGLTPSGRPYVAMEYVDGEPIDVFCDRGALPVRERLDIFRQVTSALGHAHRNLIIHRDIKPSNILVTADGVPKLLDFGIAKLLDSSLPHAAPETRSGINPMTPEYASPEQVRGEPLTMASDIYQLGYLLYRLVTGSPPYRIDRRNYVDVLDAVCNREPLRPSHAVMLEGNPCPVTQPSLKEAPVPFVTALETLDALKLSDVHSIQRERLRKALRGDLDAIALKALRKEPEARYPSAEAFAEDIERYLSGMPVTARGGTAGYLTRSFVRRHRWGVAASLAFVVTLVGLGTAHTVRVTEERNRAQLEAQKSTQVVDFLMSLFEANDPREAGGESVTALELLTRGVEQAEQLDAQPHVQALMFEVVGRVYRSLGQYDNAEQLAERALVQRRQLLGERHRDVAISLNSLADVLIEQGSFQAAERLLRNALDIQEEQLPGDHPHIAETLNNLGTVSSEMGRYATAEDYNRKSLEIRRKHFGEAHADVAESLNNLGLALMDQGKYDQAEKIHRQTLEVRRKVFGETHLDITFSLNNLALTLHQRGTYEEAEPYYRELLDMDRKLLGDDHPEVALDMNNLAGLLANMGNYDEAEALHRQALEMRLRLLGERHPDVSQSQHNLAKTLYQRGKLEQADSLYRAALNIRREVFGDEHPQVANVLSSLGIVLMAKGHYDASEDLQRQALTLRRALLGHQHPRVALSLNYLALALDRKGQHLDAERLHREAIAISTAVGGDDHWLTADHKSGLGACLTRQGRFNEAETLLMEAHTVVHGYELGDRGLVAKHARENLITLYESWGRPQEAAAYRAQLDVAP